MSGGASPSLTAVEVYDMDLDTWTTLPVGIKHGGDTAAYQITASHRKAYVVTKQTLQVFDMITHSFDSEELQMPGTG